MNHISTAICIITAALLAVSACTVDDTPVRHVEEQGGDDRETSGGSENPDEPVNPEKTEEPKVPPINFNSFSLAGQGFKQIKSTITDTSVVVMMTEGAIVRNLTATFDAGGAEVYSGDILQESGKTANNFAVPVRYRICTADGRTGYVTVSVMFHSDVPSLYIYKNGRPLPQDTENWVENYTIASATPDGKVVSMGKTSMKGRGNSSWWYVKKPYNIKLDKRQSMLDMPEHKRWCLMANWMDRTSLRNDIAFEIAHRTKGMAWAPHGRFVNLVLNGKDVGLYYVCEQIRIDENRVNITEMDHADNSGDKISGGYLMELDVYYDETFKFYSSHYSLPIMVKQPDEDVMTYSKLLWLKNYVADLEHALKSNPSSGKYREYLDPDSFIDFWFVQELVANGEPGHPKSCYMYKDRGGKIFAGPVWDFDWGTFNDNTYSLINRWNLWYGDLFNDPWFVKRVKEKWNEEKEDFRSVADYIDTISAEIETSAEANCRMWPINQDVNGDETLSYKEAVQRLKSNYTARFNYLDRAIAAL